MAGGSFNTENEIAYCKRCKRKRQFLRVKIRSSSGGGSAGYPTRWICSKGHTTTLRPSRTAPKRKSYTPKGNGRRRSRRR